MCLYPRLIKNPKYKENQKNGGVIPAVNDPRVLYVPIGCGKCMECMKQKARNWQVRLSEEIKHTPNAYFITLTFSNESIAELAKDIPVEGYQLDNAIATKAVRRFLERWRKEHNVSLRHWLVTELGHQGTENIHLHGVIWLKEKTDILKIDRIWQYGFAWKGSPIQIQGKTIDYKNYVNEKTIAYICKYVTKRDEQHKYYNSIILSSPGIGNQYTKTTKINRNKYKEKETRETYKTETGHEIALPTYYRNKIYTEEQREKLWIEKLDKEERWVNKIKIDVSKGYTEYFEQVNEARKINKRLKYGDDQIDYQEKEYENQLRILKQQQRIQNTRPSARGNSKDIE